MLKKFNANKTYNISSDINKQNNKSAINSLLRILCIMNTVYMVLISGFLFKSFPHSSTKWDTLFLSFFFVFLFALTFINIKSRLAVFLYCVFVIGEELHMMHLFGVETSFHINIILLIVVIFYDAMDNGMRNIMYSMLFNIIAISAWLLIQKTKHILPVTYNDLFVLSILNTTYIMAMICITIQFYYKKFADNEADLRTYAVKLEEMANRDALTNLLNRRGLFSTYYKNIKSDEVTVVMSDIDFFKKVNDSYGHDIGDMVLLMVAGTLSKCGQFAISRWGGEEFLLLFDSADKDMIYKKLDECRTKIQNEKVVVTNDKMFNVTISFGAYSFKRKEMNIEDAISKADENLYESKTNGRNMITYK